VTPFDGIACISIAVRSIEEALPAYTEGLGLEVTHDLQESPRGFDLRWVELGAGGRTFLELLEPTSEESPVHRFLERRGPGVYQVRFLVDDVGGTLADLAGRGVRTVEGAHADGYADVGFVHPASTHGVLIEVMERRAGS
jgi:methylmalonyl-CoA epimerase